MSAQASEIRVTSLDEIADLLTDPHRVRRIAACESIAASPDKALALRSNDRRDIVDVLIGTFEATRPLEDKIALLGTLQHFPGRRLESLLRALLQFETADSLLQAAAGLVDQHSFAWEAAYWLELLRDPASVTRVRIAAGRMPGPDALATGDRILVAAFSETSIGFPEVTRESLAEWQLALEGPYSELLLLALERSGPAFAEWCAVWDELDGWLQHWLVRLACSQKPPVEQVLQQAIDTGDSDLLLRTRDAVRLYGPELSEGLRRRVADANR